MAKCGRFFSLFPQHVFKSAPQVSREVQSFGKMSTRNSKAKSCPSSSPIVLFYDPQVYAPDPLGRDLNTILGWPDVELEYCHNYIQYLFPIPERSNFNDLAPVIDEQTYLAFGQRPELRTSLKRSYIRMLAFYGFECSENSEGYYVSRTLSFKKAATTWVRRFDHNHLRITRILRSLRILGLAMEAEALWRALEEVCEEKGVIGQKSRIFWTRAVKRPLRLAPEDEENEDQGAGLLFNRSCAEKYWLPGYENHNDDDDNHIAEEQDKNTEKENMDEVDTKVMNKTRKRIRAEGAVEIDRGDPEIDQEDAEIDKKIVETKRKRNR